MIRASRILVPVNGNPTDDEAIALACEVARRGKSAVYAIYVIEVKRTLPLDVDLPPEAAKGDTVLGRAERVADEFGIELEVVDLRSLVPLDVTTVLESVRKTQRLFTVEENPRLCGWGAEVVSIVAEEAIYSLDGPVVRITTPHVPLASAPALEDLAMPSADRIAGTVRRRLEEAR